ncbi:helix-turn-helix transcriptional regulator [Spirillospora sp. NPDC052242]
MTFGEKMKALMAERGLSLRKLAVAVHYDVSLLSKVSRDLKPPSRALAHQLDTALGADGELAALAAEPATRDPRGEDSFDNGSRVDLLALAWTVGRLDQNVDRRAVLQLAATLAAAPALGVVDPIERIAGALTRPTGLSEDIVSHLEARSIGFHRLEFVLPAEQIFRSLLSHLSEVTSLLEAGPRDRLRARLARVAGETAVLGAWLAWDLGDAARAASLYRVAGLAAREGDDPAILACSAIYQSFAGSAVQAHGVARRSLAEARQYLPGDGDPATRAWLLGREAEEAAALGDRAAGDMIEQASDLMANARPHAERPWTRCLESPRFAHMRLTIATRLGDESGVHDEVGELVVLASDPAQKKTGRMLASVGLALVGIGDTEEGIRFGERAVDAVETSRATYALNRLSELDVALAGDPRARQVRERIRATRRELASPRPSTTGTTPALR